MRRNATRLVAVLLLMTSLLLLAGSSTGQRPSMPEACMRLAFSTEEDFVTQGPTPPDGDPIISDGDLLGPNCIICARNRDLVGPFDVNPDLGLDAVDVLDVEKFVVAFSTELDSPNQGQFTAGDLLITWGNIIIPNAALTIQRQTAYDVGLDAVHFIGEPESILDFVEAAMDITREDWLGDRGMLPRMLEEYGVDIWYSTEGAWIPDDPIGFLDGDLLSAGTGTIVARNGDLLPNSVPAGLPMRGVDFGLDAFTGERSGQTPATYLSTSLLYAGSPAFNDGDVILFGNGVVRSNESLIRCFEPHARFLGLDALHMPPVGFSRLYLPVTLWESSRLATGDKAAPGPLGPEPDTPRSDAPHSDAPHSDAPHSDAPHSDAPAPGRFLPDRRSPGARGSGDTIRIKENAQ